MQTMIYKKILIAERDLVRARGDRERHPLRAERLNAVYRIEALKERLAGLNATNRKIHNRLYSRNRLA